MKKIRVGYVGTAHDHSPQYLSCILKYPEVFEVIGLVEKRESQRTRIYVHWLDFHISSFFILSSAPFSSRET